MSFAADAGLQLVVVVVAALIAGGAVNLVQVLVH